MILPFKQKLVFEFWRAFSVMGHLAITLRQVVSIVGKMTTPMKTMITMMKRLLLHLQIIHGVESHNLQFGTTIITMMRTPTPMEISSIAVIMIKTMIMCTIKILGKFRSKSPEALKCVKVRYLIKRYLAYVTYYNAYNQLLQ